MAKYQFTPEEKKYVTKGALLTFWSMISNAQQVMQAKSFAMSMIPALKVWYKDDPERMKEIMLMHADTFFNSHSVGHSLIAGIALAMEKERAEKGQVTTEAIQSIKASLMGPTAGIGDSFYYNVVRVIAAGIGIGLAVNGSLLAPLVFILIYGGIVWGSKYYFYIAGYTNGVSLVDKAYQLGIIPLLSRSASVLGGIMVGALVSSYVKLNIKFAPTFGGAVVDMQAVLDSIAPGLLAFVIWWLTFKQLQKGMKPMTLIWIIMGGCILLAALKIV